MSKGKQEENAVYNMEEKKCFKIKAFFEKYKKEEAKV